MTTWMRSFFLFPETIIMQTILMMNDHVMMFLLSILIVVFAGIFYSFLSKFINMEFFDHHQLEVVWTIIPFVILSFIAVPSLISLYILDSCFFCGLTFSILGHQWYWSYFYKEMEMFSFDSYMDHHTGSCSRLLEVDNRLVIPQGTPFRFLLTSSDVIHSWTLPSFGVKMDAIPGRINQFCVSPKRPGLFFGQCSEICGTNHSFMPIAVEVVSPNDFSKMIF